MEYPNAGYDDATYAALAGTGGAAGGYGYIPSGTSPLIAQEGITKWLQNPKEIIKEIGLKLRGLEYVKQDGTRVLKQVREPMLQEHGIKSVLSTLDFHINRTVTLSNIEEEMINKMQLQLVIAVAGSLQQEWVRAGLFKEQLPEYMKSPEYNMIVLPNNLIVLIKHHKIQRIIEPNFDVARYKLVLKNIDDIIYANLRRAKDGGERNFLTKITQENIQTVRRDSSEQQGGGGMVSKLLGLPPLFKK